MSSTSTTFEPSVRFQSLHLLLYDAANAFNRNDLAPLLETEFQFDAAVLERTRCDRQADSRKVFPKSLLMRMNDPPELADG